MPKDLFAEDTLGAYDYDIIQPTAPDPCAALRKQLIQARPNFMGGVNHHIEFITNVASKILQLAPSKGLSFYGTMFVLAHSAFETEYGSARVAIQKNNYWGHVYNGSVPVDYSHLTFSESFDEYLGEFYESWPDMITLLQSTTKVVIDPLVGPIDYDYYFTAEEVNQALNSGKYGGNGYNNTPKIIQSGTSYNAEFYGSEQVDYGPLIFRTLLKYLFRMFFPAVNEVLQLSSQNPPCEPDIPAITDIDTRNAVLTVQHNMKWIADVAKWKTTKDYGYYMPNNFIQAISPANPITNADGDTVSRPPTNISNRIKIPNSKGVTVPDPID